MRAELLELHQRLETTIIYVTHDQLEAMTMGNRIVVMRDGIVQQVDTPETVYDHPVNKFVAGFIGSPSMNFVKCQISLDNGSFFATAAGFNLKIPDQFARQAEEYLGREATLGIRPEFLTDAASCQNSDPSISFHASVKVIESAGSEKLVHIRTKAETLVAKLDPHVRLKIGDRVNFTARMELAHLFDIETEKTIF
jgi:multiple sugar transport system ATP-binding protein